MGGELQAHHGGVRFGAEDGNEGKVRRMIVKYGVLHPIFDFNLIHVKKL